MAKRTGEAAHVRLGGNGRLGRTNPEAAARTKPVPSPSRLNAPTRLPVENSPVFFLLFTGMSIFALAAVVPILSFKGPIRRKSRRLEKKPRFGGHAASGLFWPNEPKEAARSAFGQTIPRGSPVTPVAKQTQAADQSASSPNEPDEQPSRSCFRKRTQGAAQCRFGLNERTPMNLRAPSP